MTKQLPKAQIYFLEGDYDKALQNCKQGLSINNISKQSKLKLLELSGWIYFMKSELNQALKYHQKCIPLAEELNRIGQLVRILNNLGYIYRMIGKINLAIECLERSLMLSEKRDFPYQMARSLAIIILTYLDGNSREKANQYLSRLVELYNQTKCKGDVDLSFFYKGGKAFMLKTSTRMRDRVQAQVLFKELIDTNLAPNSLDSFLVLSNYCDLLLEELSLYNDPEILDEINVLITKSIDMAQQANSYSFLAETKLLQAKLALIEMNIEEAKKLMVQAQHIADSHGLNLLAWGISSEFDKLLDQIDVWNTVKKDGAPISERIKLASTNEVLERIQGKRALEPAELVDEEPILLLIMDNSGATYFNHPFVSNWDHSDLFSSFLSAFNTFSDEIFSKSIDRIRIGENTILINPVEPYLACYVIKGQSYPALQKLMRFTEAIRESSEIWQALNKSVKTSEVLELDKSPTLKTVIDEIFTQ